MLNFRANIAAISFITSSIPFFIMGQVLTGIALSLGSIAAGIADTASVTTHRRFDFFIALILFYLMALGVNYCFDHSIIFSCYVGISSFTLFMLSVYSPRLGTIGFSTILAGIYAMLLYNPHHNIFYIPTTLAIGALWYGMWQWIASFWFTNQDDKDLLFEIYQITSKKLLSHAKPLLNLSNNDDENFIAAATLRSQFTIKFDELQHRIYQQLSAGENSQQLLILLKAIQTAELIAEQTRLMHFSPSNAFRQHFAPWLFHIHYTAETIANNLKHFSLKKSLAPSSIDFVFLREIATIAKKNNINLEREINLAIAFIDKLEIIYLTMQDVTTPSAAPYSSLPKEASSSKRHVSIKQKLSLNWQRFISQFSLKSNYFRHALRGSLCLTSGLIFIRIFDWEFGFWTLMTSLLVLKPNLSMTWSRLLHRVSGTLTGLAVVALMLYFQMPSYVLPITFCIAATLFFHTTTRQYGFSVFCVTIFVFSGFALNGQGEAIMLPRLENTFLGVLLPIIFVLLISPGWQKHTFPTQLMNTIKGYVDYLSNLRFFLENNKGNHQQHLQPLFQRCVRDDTNLFDHWLGYLSEPKQNNRVSEAIILCCHSSNIMLRILTELNNQINHINKDDIATQLDDTIDTFTQLDERLKHFTHSPYFFNYLSEHKTEISKKLQTLEYDTATDPNTLLNMLKMEIMTLLN